jgi:hypothetical protein
MAEFDRSDFPFMDKCLEQNPLRWDSLLQKSLEHSLRHCLPLNFFRIPFCVVMTSPFLYFGGVLGPPVTECFRGELEFSPEQLPVLGFTLVPVSENLVSFSSPERVLSESPSSFKTLACSLLLFHDDDVLSSTVPVRFLLRGNTFSKSGLNCSLATKSECSVLDLFEA